MFKSFCNKIQVKTKKDNEFFNIPNVGLVEIKKDLDCYKLVLSSENGIFTTEFEVIISIILILFFNFCKICLMTYILLILCFKSFRIYKVFSIYILSYFLSYTIESFNKKIKSRKKNFSFNLSEKCIQCRNWKW
jgi:hypothetical protein